MATPSRTRLAPALMSVLVSTLMIAGCAGPAPVSTPSPVAASASATPDESATPTPEAVAEAALITIAASGLFVTDAEGATLLQLPYSTDPAVAVDQLTDVLGETATALVEPGGVCAEETTVSNWGSLRLYDPAGFAAGPGALFTVAALGASTAGGVPIVSTAGFAVGDTAASIAALGGISTVDYGAWVSIYSDLQVASFDDPYAWGVSGYAPGGVLAQFFAPVYFYYDC